MLSSKIINKKEKKKRKKESISNSQATLNKIKKKELNDNIESIENNFISLYYQT